jgi:uncharacterized membrane-anchored protein YitT (DUF2179 family)
VETRVADRARMLPPVRNDRLLVTLAIVVGVVLIAIGIVYFALPAKSLPGFFPGHQAGSNHHHVKHGLAALLLGAACLVFAWFRTGPKRPAASAS